MFQWLASAGLPLPSQVTGIRHYSGRHNSGDVLVQEDGAGPRNLAENCVRPDLPRQLPRGGGGGGGRRRPFRPGLWRSTGLVRQSCPGDRMAGGWKMPVRSLASGFAAREVQLAPGEDA